MRSFLVAIAVIAAAQPAEAQTATSDPTSAVREGDRIVVTATNARLHGRVVAVRSTVLTLEVDAKHFAGADPVARTVTHTVKTDDIQRIQHDDSVWNGLLIGLVAGAVPGSYIGQASCGEGPSGTCFRNGTIGALIFGGLGALIGAGIDGTIKRTIFRRNATVALGTRGRGFSVDVRF